MFPVPGIMSKGLDAVEVQEKFQAVLISNTTTLTVKAAYYDTYLCFFLWPLVAELIIKAAIEEESWSSLNSNTFPKRAGHGRVVSSNRHFHLGVSCLRLLWKQKVSGFILTC